MSDRMERRDQQPTQADLSQERTVEAAPAQGAPDTTTAPANDQPTTQVGPTGMSSNAGNNATTEDSKTRYGYYIVLAGLILVAFLYISTIIIFALLTPDNLANNVVAAMGAITG